MEICVFYSWQSKYRDNCDKIIRKALVKALREMNREQGTFHYYLKRGGGDVLGSEHIDNNIDKIINNVADIAIVDFTHNGNMPQQNPDTGEWTKDRLTPNTNAVYEDGKLEYALGARQVFKVYNTAYGELDKNLLPPFDLRQEHYPIPFYCDGQQNPDERKDIVEGLKTGIKGLIEKCTEEYVEHQKVRYAPLTPLHNEYSKELWQTDFKKTALFNDICDRISNGLPFRLLGLPGLGKTRIVGEAFRGRDIDVYYCDCKEQSNIVVEEAVRKLMTHRGNQKQTVILDNCSQKLCGYVTDSIRENGYNCQLITIHYDPSESVDTGIDGITMKVGDTDGVVEAMVDEVTDMPKEVKEKIIDMSGGFPLMATIMIENFHKGVSIVNVSKKDVYERMLGVEESKATDQDKLKVLTAFAIFKFIGLYGPQEKQGRFIAGNRIITNIRGTEDDNLQLFKEVHGEYSKMEILEKQGNLVLMRLIPLAIYLCKSWFDRQTTESIGELINQIRSYDDEGTRNMLIESLSRRITLLNEVPLAQELNDGLTNPDKSPFLTEEVVLSTLGSRLFLAFAEVNPEACAFALHRMIEKKSDSELIKIEPARRNLAWALDHMAFDKRSFWNAMLTLARLSLVETEPRLSNNTTGLFTERYPVALSGTEVDLMTRVELLKELSKDGRNESLIKQSLHIALGMNHFHRTGGAEKQGTRTLKDYVPTYEEVNKYLNACFDMLLGYAKTSVDIDEIAKTVAANARSYYMHGEESFLFRCLEELAPRKDYAWEEMRDALTYLTDYDTRKRQHHKEEEFKAWRQKLTKDDYVYTLLHADKEIRRLERSFEDGMKKTNARYEELACELIDKKLYENETVMTGVMNGQCFHYNIYGMTLSSYSKEKGIQKELLSILLDYVLQREVSKDGESMLIYFMLNVEDRDLIETAYQEILMSGKKRLLPAMFAIKGEKTERLQELFDLLDRGDIAMLDFRGYFNYLSLRNYNVKYVAGRLLDYGAEGAAMVLTHCYNLLFGDQELDSDYEEIGRRCLIGIDLKGMRNDDYVYLQSMNNYLVKHRDEEMAWHVQKMQESSFNSIHYGDNYYLGRLYRKVLKSYKDELKSRLFELLLQEDVRHQWINLMQTSYPEDKDGEQPVYMIISSEEWFDWLGEGEDKDKVYALAMIFQYSNGNEVNPDMLRLIDKHWGFETREAISSRLHSFSWSGSGIPLYMSRIALCEDYISKLSNDAARAWFAKDIEMWKQEIENERLQNAHERALYD